jgi:serine/threonine protein kinase
MFKDKFRFVDEYGNVHERGTELGRGGQGVVFRTQDPDVAVKIAMDGSGKPLDRSSYLRRLRAVRLLPIPSELQLSMPSAVLKDDPGYAMRLLDDMSSFRSFYPTGQYVPQGIPPWLSRVPMDLARELTYYCETGGLRRRLLGLYKCAAILGRLHAAGLVYGDISPSNIYMSSDFAFREVWLIDADNLRFESGENSDAVYTHRYGAPEVVQGSHGCSQASDCYAFAVMAFWMLTLQHPFIGDLVLNGNGCDWAGEDGGNVGFEEQAYAGMLPWIHDLDNISNSSTSGLPVELVLTCEIMQLFQETFGPGRKQPRRRPSILLWPIAIARALDLAITCPECKMHFYHSETKLNRNCPYCARLSPAILKAVAFDWPKDQPEHERPAWCWIHELSLSRPLHLPHRLLYPFSITKGDRSIIEILLNQNEILVKVCDSLDDHRLSIGLWDAESINFKKFCSTAKLPLNAKKTGFSLRVDGNPGRVLEVTIEEEGIQ